VCILTVSGYFLKTIHRRRTSLYTAQDNATDFTLGVVRNSHIQLPVPSIIEESQTTEDQMSQGTRTQFGEWLSEKKHLTHTAYSHLAVPAKASIYDEYRKSTRKGVATDGNKEEAGQKEG
jgi:hypothetical protein